MIRPPKVGTAFEKRLRVDPQYTVHFAEQGVPPVLATPWLIWFLEHAALDLMLPFLDPGEMTVGVYVEIEHLAPTPAREEVTCIAKVVHAEGPLVTLQIEARDRSSLIARGVHKRRVVQSARFAELARSKQA